METLATFLIIALLVYALFITYLYNSEVNNRDQHLADKSKYLEQKNEELLQREKKIVESEKCTKNLAKVMTIHKAAVDLLQSYVTKPNENGMFDLSNLIAPAVIKTDNKPKPHKNPITHSDSSSDNVSSDDSSNDSSLSTADTDAVIVTSESEEAPKKRVDNTSYETIKDIAKNIN